jgi:hypothetical protein
MVQQENDLLVARAMLDDEFIRSPENSITESTSNKRLDRPKPMGDEAYIGLIGDVVKEILPTTEASREGLFASAKAAFGAYVGRGPHARASGPRHGANDFDVLIGPTAIGAKGTAYSNLGYLMQGDTDNPDNFQGIDRAWWEMNKLSGIGSGEGLIKAVRDPAYNAQGEVSDEGAFSKSKLVNEEELAGVYKVMERPTNILSPIMRLAWSGDTLQQVVKNHPMKATNPHISVLGHIVPEEFRSLMSELSTANGFGNRFLHYFSIRSKDLPSGGGLPDWERHATDIKRKLQRASEPWEYKRNGEAEALWTSVYSDLTATTEGLLGNMTARNRAHALRLQVLYAALDGAKEITTEHVLGSIAVVQYNERTLKFIYGDRTGNRNADKIIAELRRYKFVTKPYLFTTIFQKNYLVADIDNALDLLLRNNYIRVVGNYTIEINREGEMISKTFPAGYSLT